IFAELMRNINGEVVNNLFRSTQQLAAFEQFLAQIAMMQQQQAGGIQIQDGNLQLSPGARPAPAAAPAKPPPHTPARAGPKLILPSAMGQKKPLANVGRNDACPCGSGKKFKSCCGRLA